MLAKMLITTKKGGMKMGEAKRRIEAGQYPRQEIQQIDIGKLDTLTCECGCTEVRQALVLKKMSEFDTQNPTGKLLHYAAITFFCVKCSKPTGVFSTVKAA
jgi:hypothetical protein